MELYEDAGESEINTVVNTSILPCSYENTEREFSPFEVSPLISPRLLVAEHVATANLTTEASNVKAKGEERAGREKLEDGIREERKNYLRQLMGDSDDLPGESSNLHSRENSISR
jgi:hypothetical protein